MNKLAQKVKAPRPSIGVDVGQHGIRIVGVAGKDKNKTLQHVVVEKREGETNTPRNLGRLWKSYTPRGKGAHCNLGPVSVIVQQVEFPEMDEQSVVGAARIEAEQLIPDYHQMALDIQILGRGEMDENGNQPIRALIVAAPQTAVKERIKLFGDADIEIESIVPDGIALANAVTVLQPQTDSAIMALDIGEMATNLVAISPPAKAIAPIVRFIHGGVSNLARDNGSENAQSSRERQASGERWLREIERSIQFVSDRLDAPTSEILVVGDGANNGELLEWISQAIQTPIKPWNPLKDISPGMNVSDKEIIENQGHQCAIALGLALMEG